jgi:hypothetical protein
MGVRMRGGVTGDGAPVRFQHAAALPVTYAWPRAGKAGPGCYLKGMSRRFWRGPRGVLDPRKSGLSAYTAEYLKWEGGPDMSTHAWKLWKGLSNAYRRPPAPARLAARRWWEFWIAYELIFLWH